MTGGVVIQGQKVARVLALISALLVSAFAFAADESYYGPRLIEEQVRIPAAGGYEVATTILRPEGNGPFGVVVLNHGVSASARERNLFFSRTKALDGESSNARSSSPERTNR